MTVNSITSSADAAGAALWKDEGAQHSIMLPYVRDHADHMMARVRQENPRVHYMVLKKVDDVSVYKRIHPPQRLNVGTTDTTTSSSRALPSSSFSSLDFSSKNGASIECAQFPGDFEYRGITRVPGSINTVLDVLASESARENYWVALNTMIDVEAAALLSSARLQSPIQLSANTSELGMETTAFPRWSRKYTAAKFSKQNSQVLDCCYAEYATRFTETNYKGRSRRRAIVYRRSISERALSSVSAERLAQAKVPRAARYFIRNWLLDVIETQDPMICKLVLTCTVLVPPVFGRGATVSVSDFRNFCTVALVGTRRALANQWIDHAALTGVRSSSTWRRNTRCCTVCSTQFSLLRKRYTCRSCGNGVCFQCSMQKDSSPYFNGFMISGARSQHCRNLKRECQLCAKFALSSGSSPSHVGSFESRSHHLLTSVATMSRPMAREYPASSRGRAQVEIEQEEVDQAHPDLELRSTTSVTGSRRHCSQRSLGSGSNLRITGQDDEDYKDKDAQLYVPRTDLQAKAFKLRMAYTESGHNTSSGPGIILLSDVDKWTLSSALHRMSARSAGDLSSSPSHINKASRLPTTSASTTPTGLHTQKLQHRNDRAASENNVLLVSYVWPHVGTKNGPQESSYSTEEDEDVYSEDDLANFTLKLVETTQ